MSGLFLCVTIKAHFIGRRKGELLILKTLETGLGELTPDQMKILIEQSLDADKAQNIDTIDLREQSALADYIVVASGQSSRQIAALAEKLRDRLKARGVEGIKVEGLDSCNWVVLDAGDIVVHLFRPEVRDFYNIEKMWKSFPQTTDITGATAH